LENGELLKAVEEAGFEVMITSDENLEYQQNLKNRKTALVVLGFQSRPMLQSLLPEIVACCGCSFDPELHMWKCLCLQSRFTNLYEHCLWVPLASQEQFIGLS
jgi:hypothetical protein